MVNIRPAVETEQHIIRHIVWVSNLYPFALNWQRFLVAEQSGQVIGVVQVRYHAEYRELSSLAVLPQYQGQGIAPRLIATVEARVGLPLYLFCQDKLVTYYHRFGFQRLTLGDVPTPLRTKTLLAFTFPRLLGTPVAIMRKDTADAFSRMMTRIGYN
jgi:N-acetylglutamate synthase-like GNAT family acetyltransferase